LKNFNNIKGKANNHVISQINVESLFDCLWSQEQFFSYLVAVTITGDRASNLDIYALHLWLLTVRVLLCATPAAT
jgi:hypothetical protein